jgi:hypothetical protein
LGAAAGPWTTATAWSRFDESVSAEKFLGNFLELYNLGQNFVQKQQSKNYLKFFLIQFFNLLTVDKSHKNLFLQTCNRYLRGLSVNRKFCLILPLSYPPYNIVIFGVLKIVYIYSCQLKSPM